MNLPDTKITTTLRKSIRMELTGDNLLCAMRAAGFSIPVNAVPHVNVPGGGDWSNMKLEIDADCPLIISWEVAELS